MSPEVVVSAGNITHYHQAALALQEAGLLGRYFCVFYGITGGEPWAPLLPAGWRKRLLGKRLPGLAPSRVQALPLPYLASQALRRMGLLTPGQADYAFSAAFDRQVARRLPDCRLFHWVATLGLESARRARARGSLCVLDVRAEHLEDEIEKVRQEHVRLGLPYFSKRWILAGRLEAEVALADALIAPSEFAARSFIQRGFPPERVFVLPYGVEAERFAPPPDGRPEAPPGFRLLFVGSIIPRKGVHYLLQAFAGLALPAAELTLVGRADPAYRRRLEQMIPPGASVRFLPHLPQLELGRVYQASDLFVFPSISEGSALVVYEALAAGLPVITTPNAGSVVRDGVEGFIVPSRDAEALREKMLALYQNPELLRNMSQAAHRRAQEYTWERYRARLQALYTELLGLGRRG